LVLFDSDIRVSTTIVGGEILYSDRGDVSIL